MVDSPLLWLGHPGCHCRVVQYWMSWTSFINPFHTCLLVAVCETDRLFLIGQIYLRHWCDFPHVWSSYLVHQALTSGSASHITLLTNAFSFLFLFSLVPLLISLSFYSTVLLSSLFLISPLSFSSLSPLSLSLSISAVSLCGVVWWTLPCLWCLV